MIRICRIIISLIIFLVVIAVRAEDEISVTPTPTVIESPTPTVTVSDSPTPTPTDVINLQNNNESSSSAQTSEASSSADIINILNTNIIGDNLKELIINQFSDSDQPIDLSSIELVCYPENNPSPVFYKILNNNSAVIDNSINLTAISGDNSATTQINTGDAIVKANLFNMANTNLIGRCGFFNVTNIFGKQTGDIILPYELDLIDSRSSIGDLKLANNNNVEVISNIIANTNSGGSIGSNIQSGNSDVTTNILTTVNTNITGNNWLFLKINNYGNWQGQLQGWRGNLFQQGNVSYLWSHISNAGTNGNSFDITDNNTVFINNSIFLNSNSGSNSSEVTAADATAVLNMFNFVNTNLVGNNWYFSTINLFDDFYGNVIFPRPNLNILLKADRSTAHPGDNINYSIYYLNNGRIPADNAVLTFNDQNYQLGRMIAGKSGKMEVTVKISEDISAPTEITTTATIATTTEEPEKNDNQSSITVKIIAQEVQVESSGDINNNDNDNNMINTYYYNSQYSAQKKVNLGQSAVKKELSKKSEKNVLGAVHKKENNINLQIDSLLKLIPGITTAIYLMVKKKSRI